MAFEFMVVFLKFHFVSIVLKFPFLSILFCFSLCFYISGKCANSLFIDFCHMVRFYAFNMVLGIHETCYIHILRDDYLFLNNWYQYGLRLQVILMRELAMKQSLRNKTTAIGKALRWAKCLLNSQRKRRQKYKRFCINRWFQRFGIDKE